MRIRAILSGLFLTWISCAHAGNKTDSLENILGGKIPDSTRIDVCNQLSYEFKYSDPGKAEEYALQAVELSEKNGTGQEKARSQHTAGTIYYIQAKYPEALNHYLAALRYREETHDSVNMAKAYNNIALVYYAMGDHLQSLQYHFRSIAIKQKRNDLNGLAFSYGNVGNIYYDMGSDAARKDKIAEADSLFMIAKKYQENAREIQEKLVTENPGTEKYEIGLAGTYNNLGNIALELGVLNNNSEIMFGEALAYHKRALVIQEEYNDLVGKSHSHINIAGVYERQRQYDKSILEYSIALQVALELDLPEEEKVVYEGLSQVYEKKGDFKKSLEYYKLYTAIKDTIFNELKAEQIAEMQEKYNAEKSEKEIVVLSKDKEIAQAELEKEKVLKRSFTWGFAGATVIGLLTIAFLFILWNRYRLKTRITAQLEEQNALIGMKNKEITDSIRYAKRIQVSILPPDSHVSRLLPDSFILYKPKDIVSGDFYWAEEWGGKTMFAVADCTGHGVPGAFMSIVGHNLLDQAVTVYGLDKPSLILNYVNKQLFKILHQEAEEHVIKDGMDISLVAVDKKTRTIEFSGAFNSLWLVRGNELTEFRGDRLPVGALTGEIMHSFSNKEVAYETGDRIYMMSDGFADQFGGPQGKKFKVRQLKQLLTETAALPMKMQGEKIAEAFDAWKGNLEQIDDVCVVGIRM